MAQTGNHTPGPWVYSGRLGFGHLVSPNIAVAYGGATSGRQDSGGANARLIAAAPDMLNALKKSAEGWANAIELGIIAKQHVATAEILRDEALAIIAKAEGRAALEAPSADKEASAK